MKKIESLTGKNLPRLAVAKPGWPEPILSNYGEYTPITVRASTITPQTLADFTRVCDQTGLTSKRGNDDNNR